MPPIDDELKKELDDRLAEQEERHNKALEELRARLEKKEEDEKPVSARERLRRGFEAIREEREGKGGGDDE